MAITKKQKRVLDWIRTFVADHGYSPSYEEIARGLQFSSKGTVHKHLKNLMEKGYITKSWNRSRSIDLVGPSGDVGVVSIPLLGRVAAGAPIEAVRNDETISVPEDMLGRGNHYVLKVRGNSMIDEQIRDGDYVIVEERTSAENGETVVALIKGDEATVKKIYKENGNIRLQPANEDVEPIVLPAEEVTVQGVVIGVMRKYS